MRIGKSTAGNLSIFLRAIAVVCSLALVAFIGTSTLTKTRPGALIDGPLGEFWAITIAISNVNFGLEGGLGYVQIFQKLHSFFSASADPFVIDKAKPLRDPQFNNQAIKAAGGMQRGDVKGGVAAEGDYLLYATDDIGYAFFYTLAFKLFGISAFATHYFYLLILVVSFVVFLATWWRSNIAIALAAITIGGIFLTANSAVISAAAPAVASNRFLTTLALLPMLHLLIGILDRGPLTFLQVLTCAVQAFVLACAIWFRSSGAWTGLAVVFAAVVMMIRAQPAALSSVVRGVGNAWRTRVIHVVIDSRSGVFKPAVVSLLTIVVLAAGASAQAGLLDRIYFTDAVLPYHVRWHSLWIGLVEHPDWPLFKPLDVQPDNLSDDVPDFFWAYNALLTQDEPLGMRATSGDYPGGLEPMRLKEDVEKMGFLTFVAHHPIYMLEAEAFYKPGHWILTVIDLVQSIPVASYLLCFPLAIVGFLLFRLDVGNIERSDLYVVFAIVWLCSSLPSLVAYPVIYALGDCFCAFLMFASVVLLGADRNAFMSMRLGGRRTVLVLSAVAITIFVIWGAGRWIYDPNKVIRVVAATDEAGCAQAEIAVPGTLLTLKPERARDFAALMCNGRNGSCVVPAVRAVGGPLPAQCASNFEVSYRCGTAGQVREASASGEGKKRRVVLSCASHG